MNDFNHRDRACLIGQNFIFLEKDNFGSLRQIFSFKTSSFITYLKFDVKFGHVGKGKSKQQTFPPLSFSTVQFSPVYRHAGCYEYYHTRLTCPENPAVKHKNVKKLTTITKVFTSGNKIKSYGFHLIWQEMIA